MILTALYDLKTNTFFNYFFVKDIVDIERMYHLYFKKDDDAKFVQFPDDFDLYKLGEIDSFSGEFINKKELIRHMLEFVQNEKR